MKKRIRELRGSVGVKRRKPTGIKFKLNEDGTTKVIDITSASSAEK